MSGCCGNPGVGDDLKGLAELPVYTNFNPGEVRLYGRPGGTWTRYDIKKEDLAKATKKTVEENAVLKENLKNVETGTNSILNVIEKIEEWKNAYYMTNSDHEYILLSTNNLGPYDELKVDVNILANWTKDKYIQSIGVIYGYAFEGHCYKLPKPQIMYLPAMPKKILGGDCGGDCGFAPELGYAVWQIDKRSRVIALDIRSDDLQTLILDENMPGNRSPQAYAQSMAMAPQRSRE